MQQFCRFFENFDFRGNKKEPFSEIQLNLLCLSETEGDKKCLFTKLKTGEKYFYLRKTRSKDFSIETLKAPERPKIGDLFGCIFLAGKRDRKRNALRSTVATKNECPPTLRHFAFCGKGKRNPFNMISAQLSIIWLRVLEAWDFSLPHEIKPAACMSLKGLLD